METVWRQVQWLSDSIKHEALLLCPHCNPKALVFFLLAQTCHLLFASWLPQLQAAYLNTKIQMEDGAWEIFAFAMSSVSQKKNTSFLSVHSEVRHMLTCRPVTGQEQWGCPDWFHMDHCSSHGTDTWLPEKHRGLLLRRIGEITWEYSGNRGLSSQWMMRPHTQDAKLLSLLIQIFKKKCVDTGFEPTKKFSPKGWHCNIM